jgi:hypothetical protein
VIGLDQDGSCRAFAHVPSVPIERSALTSEADLAATGESAIFFCAVQGWL